VVRDGLEGECERRYGEAGGGGSCGVVCGGGLGGAEDYSACSRQGDGIAGDGGRAAGDRVRDGSAGCRGGADGKGCIAIDVRWDCSEGQNGRSRCDGEAGGGGGCGVVCGGGLGGAEDYSACSRQGDGIAGDGGRAAGDRVRDGSARCRGGADGEGCISIELVA